MTDVNITLFIGASAAHNRFAICDAVGRVVWARKFKRGDGFAGNQPSADAAALTKTLTLAKALRRALLAEHLYLTIHISAEWIVRALRNPKTKSKTAAQAIQFAQANKIQIIPHETPRDLNPADRETITNINAKPNIETPQTVSLATKAANRAARQRHKNT